MTGAAYLDASAMAKLVLEEPESEALHRWYIEAERLITSRVGIIETIRASARRAFDAHHRDRIVSDMEVVEVGEQIARRAAALEPAALRTLDAIHLATAVSLLPDLEAFVTYDDRLAEAARAVGLPVVRPA